MTTRLLQNLRIVDPRPKHGRNRRSILIVDGKIAAVGAAAAIRTFRAGRCEPEDCGGLIAVPGLVDACVHIGEPGAEHRETIASASRAAAKGGVTSIIMMPDTDPMIDDVALVDFVQRLARDEAVVHVHPGRRPDQGPQGRRDDRVRAAARGRCRVAVQWPPYGRQSRR
jgi:dihydroorotase